MFHTENKDSIYAYVCVRVLMHMLVAVDGCAEPLTSFFPIVPLYCSCLAASQSESEDLMEVKRCP